MRFGQNADGHLEVFGVSKTNQIWHTWQTAPSDGWNGEWVEFYSQADELRDLRVGRNQDGRLEVFGLSPDGRIWHTWQDAPSGGWNGNWSELYSSDNHLQSIEVAQNADGHLEVFGVSETNQIWHTWQVAPSDGWNGEWVEFYSQADELRDLRVGRNQDGRLEVFGLSPDGRIWHTWQDAPSGGWNGKWSELYSSDNHLQSIEVAQNADGRLEVFGVSETCQIWHTWQVAPSDGWNGEWVEFYSQADELRDLRVGRNQDGRLEVFGLSPGDRIWHTWQDAPSGGWNGKWSELATDLRVLIKVVSNPNVPIATSLANMRTVLGTANILISEGPQETITITPAPGAPPQTTFNVGPCMGGQTSTADQVNLFGNRNNAAPTDVVLYMVTLVTSDTGPKAGCAAFPPGQPGAVIARGASPWTMAHEVGHVLGLNHISGENTGCPSSNPGCCSTPDVTRLMTGCGTGAITGTPTVSNAETDGMWQSNLLRRFRLRTLDVANNADGRFEVVGVDPTGRIWHTWQESPSSGWNEEG